MLPASHLCLALNRNNPVFFMIKKSIMKKIFLAACILCFAAVSQAQRYAIIDTKFILDKMPDYKLAQKNLDDVAANWQKEIDVLQQDLDRMYKDYDAEQVMLTEDLRRKREDQLFVKEKNLRDLQRNRFGFEGDLFKRRQELIKPIQDKVYNAVQRGYDFILDKSEGITVIFADPKLEKSEDVLRELGVK